MIQGKRKTSLPMEIKGLHTQHFLYLIFILLECPYIMKYKKKSGRVLKLLIKNRGKRGKR